MTSATRAQSSLSPHAATVSGGVSEGVSGNGVAAVGGNGATAAAAAAAAAARNTRFMMEGVGAR